MNFSIDQPNLTQSNPIISKQILPYPTQPNPLDEIQYRLIQFNPIQSKQSNHIQPYPTLSNPIHSMKFSIYRPNLTQPNQIKSNPIQPYPTQPNPLNAIQCKPHNQMQPK